MKPTLLITTLLLIYISANNFKHSSEVDTLKQKLAAEIKQRKHLESEIQKANDMITKWNETWIAPRYAKENGIEMEYINGQATN